MKFSLSSVLNNDGAQRFKGCFVLLHTPDKPPQFVYMHHVSSEGVILIDNKGGRKEVAYNNELLAVTEIETVMPHAAWRKFGKYSLLIKRTPARQWRRSLCNSTHTLAQDHAVMGYKPADLDGLRQAGYPQLHHTNVAGIEALLIPQKTSITQAMQEISEGSFSVALSDVFCLHNTLKLYLRELAVAKFFPKNKSYKVNAVFSEEVRDLCRGLNFKEIVVEKDEFN